MTTVFIFSSFQTEFSSVDVLPKLNLFPKKVPLIPPLEIIVLRVADVFLKSGIRVLEA